MTPQQRLDNAKRELSAARERCAHWDYLDDHEDPQECCYQVMEHLKTVRLAKAAVKP